MARKPKPSIPRREVAVDLDSWIGRARVLALKNMLGLGLTPEEEAELGPLPRVGVFTPGEVIALLGDGERGIPRMLPVDVALGRLGMPIVRLGPDGTPARLRKEFPKAWAAREKSDRAIATYVARTYREVPRGFYLDRERLGMSLAEAPDDELKAAGSSGLADAAEIATQFRFDLVPDELRLAGYQMWQRRRLAGIASFSGAGLVFGFWDDVMSAFDVPAPCWRGSEAGDLAVTVALARELSVAMLAGWTGNGGFRPGPLDAVPFGWVVSAFVCDPVGPGLPDRRSPGGGIAFLHRQAAARPGPTWSARPVPDRPEACLDLGSTRARHPEWRVLGGTRPEPEGYVSGRIVPQAELGWTAEFVSA